MGKRRFFCFAGVALLAMLAAAALAAGSSGAVRDHGTKDKPVGAVYSETNDFGQNAVVVFDRYANGLIVQRSTVPTGGTGAGLPQLGCPAPCPFLDDQAPLELSKDGRFLFAVNAGSNTISSFRVTAHGLTLIGQVASGGQFPYSVTSHGNLLYVLNTVSRGIAGFRISGSGKLTPIAGSQKPLSVDGAGADAPRQIGFDNTGRVLAVTLLGAPDINTFVLNGNGVPGNAIQNPSTAPLPFGFSWDARNHLVVSQVHDPNGTPTGDTATYSLTHDGHLVPIDTEGTNGFAPCWTALSTDGRFAYVVNAGGGAPSGATVSVFRLSSAGNLSLIQVTPLQYVFPFPPPGTSEFIKTDIGLSPDGNFAYVVSPGVLSSTSHIDIYNVNDDGTLTLIGLTPSTLAGGLSGMLVT